MKYANREGERWEEISGQDAFLEKLYSSVGGRMLVNILIQPWVSKAGGWLMDTRLSALAVPSVIRKYHMHPEQWEKNKFHSYNDFFTRRYKESERPINRESNVLISPCDAKLSVYTIDGKSRFKIKHTPYTVARLLENKRLAEHFRGGQALVFRLTVDDYHRYCYVDDGAKSSNHKIPGVFHTVNPIANDVEPIYKENTREYCLLHTNHFGTILMMEVGALMVGKIQNYHGAGKVCRGQEKGRFAFGGSTIVLLTEAGKVTIDEDLLKNSGDGYETLVKMGERIGIAVR